MRSWYTEFNSYPKTRNYNGQKEQEIVKSRPATDVQKYRLAKHCWTITWLGVVRRLWSWYHLLVFLFVVLRVALITYKCLTNFCECYEPQHITHNILPLSNSAGTHIQSSRANTISKNYIYKHRYDDVNKVKQTN